MPPASPSQPAPHQMNPGDLLAAERTYLAWLHTGLALCAYLIFVR